MADIRSISDLRDHVNEISDFCRRTGEPVYLTSNGICDMVIMSIEAYERQQARLDLYGKLAVAEQEIAGGAEGKDFLTAVLEYVPSSGRPLKTWDEMTEKDISDKLSRSEADIAAGRVYSQDELDAKVKQHFSAVFQDKNTARSE